MKSCIEFQESTLIAVKTLGHHLVVHQVLETEYLSVGTIGLEQNTGSEPNSNRLIYGCNQHHHDIPLSVIIK